MCAGTSPACRPCARREHCGPHRAWRAQPGRLRPMANGAHEGVARVNVVASRRHTKRYLCELGALQHLERAILAGAPGATYSYYTQELWFPIAKRGLCYAPCDCPTPTVGRPGGRAPAAAAHTPPRCTASAFCTRASKCRCPLVTSTPARSKSKIGSAKRRPSSRSPQLLPPSRYAGGTSASHWSGSVH